MRDIILFTSPECGRCHLLKKYLEQAGVNFRELSVLSPEGRTELLVSGFKSSFLPEFNELRDLKGIMGVVH
ncbi:MAG: Glutaredoxin [Methanosaeta sp. PtaU1.Bin060]|nr:MAG: Glutaredoxin [Methanosaeta sp. PtaU1.Bin060]